MLKLLTAGSVIAWGGSRSIASWQSRSHITSLMGSGINALAEIQKGFLKNSEKQHLCWYFQFCRFSKCEYKKNFFFWLALNYYCKRVTSNFLHHICCLALLILSLLQETELVVSEEIYWNSSHNTFLFFCATIHISGESQLKITFKPSKSVSQVHQQWR